MAELRTKIAAIVESQRQLGGSSYPVTLPRLAELADVPFDDTLNAVRALDKGGGPLLSLALAPKEYTPERAANAVVLASADADSVAASDALFVSALRAQRTSAACAFDDKDLAKAVNEKLGAAFRSALAQRMSKRAFPADVAAVMRNGAPVFFLLEDVLLPAEPRPRRPAAGPAAARVLPFPGPAPSDGPSGAHSGFTDRFEGAFTMLDRAAGSRNYVLLQALRKALSDIPRDDFDAGLHALRRARRFTLDASDGRHDRLTSEQLDAGIVEGGNVLVYVARTVES